MPQTVSKTPESASESEMNKTASKLTPRIAKKRCAVDDENNEAILHKAYKILTQKTELVSTFPYKSFGTHVANELRKYDRQTLSYAKKAFSDILLQVDIGQFYPTHHGPRTSSYYSSYGSLSSTSCVPFTSFVQSTPAPKHPSCKNLFTPLLVTLSQLRRQIVKRMELILSLVMVMRTD
ncbi:hypothetical protein PR048_025504 [Dryococelus australis]|uniref:Uncharacterized protein n=1 Tax=Dryococelus australis TaxID=614101 RepID=A0ABQ9GRI7_9NEOP|nr:hypothetical protein PR048_025504 [Dryococelus australis]